MHVIAKTFQCRQVGTAPPIDDDLVQDIVPGADHPVSVDHPAIQPHPYRHANVVFHSKCESGSRIADQGFVRIGRHVRWEDLQGILFFFLGVLRVFIVVAAVTVGSLDYRRRHAQGHLDRVRHLVFRKGGQESQTSPADGQERRDRSLKDAAGVHQETVASQGHDQIGKGFHVVHVVDPFFFLVVDVPDPPVDLVGILGLLEERDPFVVDSEVVLQLGG
mmetsp:Transcript_3558/g.7773  ORF Transcript_3558/g.7773 Transcript_3558/m.7773 type:complete len:219 (+) Transcript_3558:3128-3784(+)